MSVNTRMIILLLSGCSGEGVVPELYFAIAISDK